VIVKIRLRRRKSLFIIDCGPQNYTVDDFFANVWRLPFVASFLKMNAKTLQWKAIHKFGAEKVVFAEGSA
jgi:hypothetical protein